MIGLIAGSIAALALCNLALVGGFLWLVAQMHKQADKANAGLSALSGDAMDHLTAKALGEVKQAQAQQAAADAQLGYLADTLAKQSQMKKEAEPKFAKTHDGQLIDMNHYDTLDF